MLFEESAKPETDESEQRGLLLEARDLFVVCGNLHGLLVTVPRLTEPEGVAVWPEIAAAFEEAAETFTFFEQHLELVEQIDNIVNDALSDREIEVANRLVGLAISSCSKLNDRSLTSRFRLLKSNISAIQLEAEGALLAEQVLFKMPADTSAHLQLGRFLCFYLEDWENGFPATNREAKENITRSDLSATHGNTYSTLKTQ